MGIMKPKVNASWALSNVHDMLLSSRTKTAETDELGVEFELEGEDLRKVTPALQSRGCDYWASHADGSLRNGLEFTFTKPLNRTDATKAIKDFWQVAKEHAKVKNSDRCSTHMHLNFQHMSIMQVYSFLTLFYMLELPFFQRFAPERVGNGYCLPMFECSTIAQNFARNVREGVMKYGMNGSERYCALNVASLREHGSLECRMLGASDDENKPLQWMDVLLELYDYVKNNPRMTPEEILANFQGEGYTDFTRSTFPKTWEAISTVKNVEKLIQLGVYAVQDFVYAADWAPAKEATPPRNVRPVNPDMIPTPVTFEANDDFEDPY